MNIPASSVTALPPLESASREIELKFLLTPPALKAAQNWAVLGNPAPRPRARRLRSVYFDTADGDLGRHQAVLRVRSVNRRRFLTFKWNGDFAGSTFERGEVEVPAASDEPDLNLLGPEIAASIAAMCKDQALQPLYSTDVKRITHMIHNGVSDIEIAFDTGAMIAGDKKLALCELEMELKSGNPADLFDLGIALAQAFPATIGCQTKSQRAALLLAGAEPPILRASPIRANHPTVDESIGYAFNSCINHFLGNWPAFASGDSVKAVHQMRVAMRRLRSLIGVFQKSFPCPEFMKFRQTAKDLATAMAEARNWDVFIDLIRQGPFAAFPNETGFATLLADAENHRNTGYAMVRGVLAAAETTCFILSMQSFIARNGWRNSLSAEVLPKLTIPAKDFAGSNLTRLHRRIVKSGKDFASLTSYHRHEIRKGLKKIRYFSDTFNGLFSMRGHSKTFTRTVATLQDQLGIFNDLIVAEDMAARLNPGPDAASIRALGIIMGWCAKGAAADDTTLNEAWEKFRKLKFEASAV